MRIPFSIASALVWGLSFSACDRGSDDGGADNGDLDPDTDTDPGEESWSGVSIAAANAPDGYSVRVAFDGAVPAGLAADPESYLLDSAWGQTAVTGAEYDAESGQVLLSTGRQRLGVTYTVSVAHETASDLAADFLAADTFAFWAWDFASPGYAQYEVTADRIAVGTSCVVYVEQGMSAVGAAEAADHFDNAVFPTLTSLFIDAPDIDDNGRITLLGLDGGSYFGGYFGPIDAYPDEQTTAWWGLRSNEMEIVYINVVEGDFDQTRTIVPHEFQHLLYHERHGFTDPYWEYHDEGLAEAAVRAVNGYHPWAVDYYFWDPQGLIADGLSLVKWTSARYENYVQAYLFMNYVAGQLEGVETFADIFDLPAGSPAEFDAFLRQELDLGMNDVHLDQLIATWVREPSGIHSYNGMITNFPAATRPPRVPAGTTSVDLVPFAGTFFRLGVDEVSYPPSAGSSIVYAGIDAAGNVDLEEPFAVSGGALLVYNSHFEWQFWPPEHSGPDIPAAGGWFTDPAPPDSGTEERISPTWRNPPPYNPWNPQPFERWRAATRERLASRPTR